MRDARTVALDVLVRIEDGAFAHVLVPARLRASGLDPRDRAFVTRVVYGAVREQRRIDALVAAHSHQPLERLEPRVRAALRMGTYQLLHGVAPHAAVGETVRVTSPRARGFVNAVLRSVAAAGPPFPEPESRAVRYSYPDWIVDELAASLDEERLEAVLAAGNAPAAVTLRPNPLATTPDALHAELAALGIEVARGTLVPEALVVRGLGDPAELPAVAQGRATPQDEASQAVVGILDPRPGARILDIAAGPGGKATAAAERATGGLVVALDVHPGRVRLVAEARGRLGLPDLACVVADGRRVPARPEAFDRVLVDAPCTGLGVLRRRPEARWRVRPEEVAPLTELQRALLAGAAPHVARGGRLVYSVCTLTRAETLGVGSWAVAHLAGFVPAARPGPPWEPWGPGAILWPDRAGTDGMFVLTLERIRPEHAG